MVKKITIFLAPIVLIIFLASRIFFFTPTFLESTAAILTYPVIKLSSIIAKPIRGLFFTTRPHYNQLVKKCSDLEVERLTLLQKNIELTSMLHYDKKSKDLRIFRDRYKLEGSILASILVRTLTSSEHSILVNRGSRDGVEKNMVAIYKFQLIGRVSNVTPFYSKIMLITGTQSKVSVYTNTSSARGIVEGTNIINRCHLRYISHLNTVHNGDYVLSSGQGLIFPEGFCVGKIINVKKQDICYHVEVEPLIDFKTLEMCTLTSQSRMNLF